MSRICYHGTSAVLFEKFDMGHALEGDGKVKFGWGTYVTDRPETAMTYARKSKAGVRRDIYKVEIPDIAENNWIGYKTPINPVIVRKTEEALGVKVPEKYLAEGKLFIRQFLAGYFSDMKHPTNIGDEKAAIFLDSIGVDFTIWPSKSWTKQKQADGTYIEPFNFAVYNDSKVKILSIDCYDPATEELVETKIINQ